MKIQKATPNPNKLVITHVPLDLVADHPDIKGSYRKLSQEFAEELSHSIEATGLDTPLQVWNVGDPDNVMIKGGKEVPATFLIAGLHRRAALKMFRERDSKKFLDRFPDGKVPCIVRSYKDASEAVCALLRENVERRDQPAEQILPVVKRLEEEFGLKRSEIAKRVGKSKAWVSSIFDIEDTLKGDAIKRISEGGVSLSDARKAAARVKSKRAAGEDVDPTSELDKAAAKTAKKKAAGRQRDERKPSLGRVWKAYKALPSMGLGKKLAVLEGAIGFLLDEDGFDALPEELQGEETVPSNRKKKTDKDEDGE